MKLLTKTSYYYILFTIPVLLLSSVFFYYFLAQEMEESNQSILEARVKIIEGYIKKDNQSVLLFLQANSEVAVSEITENRIIPQTIKDTLLFSAIENEKIAYKKLEVGSIINGKNYKINVFRNSIEVDELIEVVQVVFVALLILLFSVLFFINLLISKRIWEPFWASLQYIKNFKVADVSYNKLENNSIKEFSELNFSINQMTSKMVMDYQNQKKFAENASHEFQTPIAIIKGKIDLLLQTKNLNEESLELLIGIEDTITRLSRINKSLLLLSKIENRQYPTVETMEIKALVERLLSVNEDLILEKNLKIVFEDSATLHFKVNPELGAILFMNLIQNAIRHTAENELLLISISNVGFSIANTGQIALNKNLIFERFEKQSLHSNSIGLGLAIVKEIAEMYHIKVSYSFENQKHIFSVHQIT